MPPQHLSFSHKMALALVALTAGIVALYLMRPIADPDFFWHLKTGQWIVQHQSLPAVDPFSLSPPPADNLQASFTLTSYWFTQVVFYALYSLGGWWGIVLLRVALVGAMVALFASRCDLRQPAKVCLLLIFFVQILETYPLDRPHAFSFVFFAALLCLLERYREQGEGENKIGVYAALVAALMLLWSNVHGGFLVGLVTLSLFFVMEGVKFFHPSLSPLSQRRYLGLGIIVLAGVTASLINPNPINSFKILLNLSGANTFLSSTNMEYYSSLRSFREYGDYTIILNWLMMAVVAFCMLKSPRRQDIVWVTLLVGTAFMGCQHVRFMPFFLVSSLFFLGKCRYEGMVGSILKPLIVVLTLFVAFWFSRDDVRYFSPFIRGQWGVDRSFPVSAADFTLQKDLPGPVYNTYLWGGYLIWRLGPERKIFCDGRALDPSRYWEYLSSTIGAESANPYWKEIFRKNGIQTAIVQMKEVTGEMNPLAASLRRDSAWELVFAKDNAAIFVRKEGGK